MVGKLKSLPKTFGGAIALGLLINYGQWLYISLPASLVKDSEGLIYGLNNSLPTIFLLGAMLLLPQEKLRVGRILGTKLPRIPSWRATFAWSAVLLVGVYLLTSSMGIANNSRFGQAMCLPLIMLSLVLLIGYGGDVSLCQLSFVGVGALVAARGFDIPFTGIGFHPQITVLSLITAFLLAAVVGALVALPALRLRGLYIGLGTLAIASAMDHTASVRRAPRSRSTGPASWSRSGRSPWPSSWPSCSWRGSSCRSGAASTAGSCWPPGTRRPPAPPSASARR
jgi:branched-chain amino acid transport system permease protein